MTRQEPAEQHVSVVGAGTIGIAWALVFATGGCRVRVFDEDRERREDVRVSVRSRLEELAQAGLLSEKPAEVIHRISVADSLSAAVAGASYVQENVPESLELKSRLFATMDELADDDAILASSTSAIPASRFTADLAGRSRCLVVHPGNPPYLLRVAELVPSEFTAEQVTTRTAAFMRSIAMSPVVVRSEIEGFAFNRLQGALLREAYFLVGEGVLTPEEVDTLVRDGLGRRWSITGPFATAELNTRGGTRRHAEILGSVYARIGMERGTQNPWTPEAVDHVVNAMERMLPSEQWEEHVRRRELAMIRLEGARTRGNLPDVAG